VHVQAAEAPYGFSTTNCNKVDCFEVRDLLLYSVTILITIILILILTSVIICFYISIRTVIANIL
jgi:hypothetical protein